MRLDPVFRRGDDPEAMHELMAATIDKAVEAIQQIQANARSNNDTARPRWPMIVLKSPKGWTGPKVVDGLQIEGTFRAHQVPLLVDTDHPDHVKLLEEWMKSYKAEELFDEQGRLIPELAELAPKGNRRMGANPHANGGFFCAISKCPISTSTRLPLLLQGRCRSRIRSSSVRSCAMLPN
jgi:xylulose-5-phosphate/fructose-6-phosphate phosphoketolase